MKFFFVDLPSGDMEINAGSKSSFIVSIMKLIKGVFRNEQSTSTRESSEGMLLLNIMCDSLSEHLTST
jgi:hypothetical protein